MNSEYIWIDRKHINSFGSYSRFYGDYYYKSYRDGTKMYYRLKAKLTYDNTTSGTGNYDDKIVAIFKMNEGSSPNYNSTKTIKPTTSGSFYDGQYWEVESDWFSLDKVDGSINCFISINNSVTWGFDSPNYEFNLDVIPALSSIIVNHETLFNVDTNENVSNEIPVEITKYVEGYTSKLKITMENNLGEQVVVKDYADFDSNILTFTEEELSIIYNHTPEFRLFVLIFDLDTYDGDTLIGTSTTRQGASLSETDLYPTFTTNFTETNTKVIDLLGPSADTVVQNASKVNVEVKPTAHKGASVSKVQIMHNNLMTEKLETPYSYEFNVANSVFDINVIDSRENPTPQRYTKPIIEYTPIEILSFSFKRENPTSSNVYLNAQIRYKQTSFKGINNVPTIKWKKGTNGTFTTLSNNKYTIDTSTNLITISSLKLENAIDHKNQDTFYLLVNDLLTEDAENELVLKGIPLYDYGEHDFQVNGKLFIADENRENPKEVALKEEVEKIESGSNENGSWLKFPDGTMIVRQSYTVNFSGSWTAWGTGYTIPVSLKEFPIEFKEIPTVNFWHETTAYLFSIMPCNTAGYVTATTTKRPTDLTLFRSSNMSATTSFTVHIIAIGKWK